ncbi:BPL-N domain-containing protein [Stenotrophomonas indicatrix]
MAKFLRTGALLAALLLISGAAISSTPPRIAVYRGEAGCDDCSETVRRSIEASGKYQVEYVGPDEPLDVTPENLKRFDLYIQPGGGQNIPAALRALGGQRSNAIRAYVDQGGHYLGLCMGAYLADANNLGLIDEELDSAVGRPGFPVHSIDDAAVAVEWLGHQDQMFFQDGPYFPASPSAGFKALGHYENGDISAAAYRYGSGKVVLTGPHPEAGRAWFEQAEIPVSRMPTSDVMGSVLAEALAR